MDFPRSKDDKTPNATPLSEIEFNRSIADLTVGIKDLFVKKKTSKPKNKVTFRRREYTAAEITNFYRIYDNQVIKNIYLAASQANIGYSTAKRLIESRSDNGGTPPAPGTPGRPREEQMPEQQIEYARLASDIYFNEFNGAKIPIYLLTKFIKEAFQRRLGAEKVKANMDMFKIPYKGDKEDDPMIEPTGPLFLSDEALKDRKSWIANIRSKGVNYLENCAFIAAAEFDTKFRLKPINHNGKWKTGFTMMGATTSTEIISFELSLFPEHKELQEMAKKRTKKPFSTMEPISVVEESRADLNTARDAGSKFYEQFKKPNAKTKKKDKINSMIETDHYVELIYRTMLYLLEQEKSNIVFLIVSLPEHYKTKNLEAFMNDLEPEKKDRFELIITPTVYAMINPLDCVYSYCEKAVQVLDSNSNSLKINKLAKDLNPEILSISAQMSEDYMDNLVKEITL
ncbi:hypothetical protein CANARDRAFT_171573 [[Candida] arabinofermentans NRRL YB-2248]|uniref:Uncharacterized protein n=1 Tax=[Candida] arabinofermentans NRRL YB-2248 TaxID=983967 RepID=A0A1E4SYU7_9ASCO|nr:hypothetical protein CANARDRAFT_171573 [[Candida] arabinofermentans NRRL YB-2248]